MSNVNPQGKNQGKTQGKNQIAAIDGWMTIDGEARLVGGRGAESGSYFFPKNMAFSRNPAAPSEEISEVQLSPRGRVWSWTTNHYKPPAPYMPADPFVPYTVLAVELDEERLVVLGRLAPDCDPATLTSGVEVEVERGVLYEDEANQYMVWQWRPVATEVAR